MRRWRPLLRGALLAMLAGTLSSCDPDRVLGRGVGDLRDLVAARARWEAQGIRTYEYTLTRTCFCGDVRPMRVDVRDGIVHSVTPEGESIPLPPSSHEYYPSIRGLFDLIARAIDLPAARLMVRYDEARGFPHEAYIDYRDTIADDEVGYVVGAIRLP